MHLSQFSPKKYIFSNFFSYRQFSNLYRYFGHNFVCFAEKNENKYI